MKKFISIIIFLVCALFSFGCYSVAEPLKGTLFDEEVLTEYELSWLKKPEKVTDEEQYVTGKYYKYKANIASLEKFEEYAIEFFTNLQKKNYAFAKIVERISEERGIDYTEYYTAEKVSKYEECIFVAEEKNYASLYISFSTLPLKYYYENRKGYLLQGAKNISIVFNEDNGIGYILISLKKESQVFVLN